MPFNKMKQEPKLHLHLQISPMGVVPQHDRHPRIIVDYWFFGVNDKTVCLAPNEAMPFGKALKWILQNIVEANPEANPKFGPIYLMKVDIADGFYRIWVCAPDIVKLIVSIPMLDREEPLIDPVAPLVLREHQDSGQRCPV